MKYLRRPIFILLLLLFLAPFDCTKANNIVKNETETFFRGKFLFNICKNSISELKGNLDFYIIKEDFLIIIKNTLMLPISNEENNIPNLIPKDFYILFNSKNNSEYKFGLIKVASFLFQESLFNYGFIQNQLFLQSFSILEHRKLGIYWKAYFNENHSFSLHINKDATIKNSDGKVPNAEAQNAEAQNAEAQNAEAQNAEAQNAKAQNAEEKQNEGILVALNYNYFNTFDQTKSFLNIFNVNVVFYNNLAINEINTNNEFYKYFITLDFNYIFNYKKFNFKFETIFNYNMVENNNELKRNKHVYQSMLFCETIYILTKEYSYVSPNNIFFTNIKVARRFNLNTLDFGAIGISTHFGIISKKYNIQNLNGEYNNCMKFKVGIAIISYPANCIEVSFSVVNFIDSIANADNIRSQISFLFQFKINF